MKFRIVNYAYNEVIRDNEGRWSDEYDEDKACYDALLKYNYEIKKVSNWEVNTYISVDSLEDLVKLQKELNCDLIIREADSEGITILQLYDGYIE